MRLPEQSGSREKPPNGGFFLAPGDFFEQLVSLSKVREGKTYVFYYQVRELQDSLYPERGYSGQTYVTEGVRHTVRSVRIVNGSVRVNFTDGGLTWGGVFDDERIWVWNL